MCGRVIYIQHTHNINKSNTHTDKGVKNSKAKLKKFVKVLLKRKKQKNNNNENIRN